MESPQIFQYLDYRAYLGDWIKWKKGMDRAFSMRVFAKRPELSLSSSSFVSAVLKGRKNLSQALRLKFGRALGLQGGELEYFESLVQFNQSKSADERNHHLAHLTRHHSSRALILDDARHGLFSRWFYRVVWNWFALHQDQNNPAQIAKAVHPPISAAEADEAIRVLLDLRLIKRLANGYAVIDRHLSTGDRFAAPEAATHHREFLQLALDNLDRVPAESRRYDALTFSVSMKGFARVRERMDAFRAELRELVEADPGADRIMALSMQLFPCTRAEPATVRPKGGASVDSGNPEPA